jgi:hypothetical protein
VEVKNEIFITVLLAMHWGLHVHSGTNVIDRFDSINIFKTVLRCDCRPELNHFVKETMALNVCYNGPESSW